MSMISITQQAFELAKRFESKKNSQLVVVKDRLQAEALSQALSFFMSQEKTRLFPFPDWETLIYDFFSPHDDLVSDRLQTLYRLSQGEPGIVIVPVSALLQSVCPKSHILKQSLVIACGQTRPMATFIDEAIQAGYTRVPEVRQHAEIAVRGALVDLYPMGLNYPVRIEWDDDEIVSLRYFEPDTQESIEKQTRFCILPASECDFSLAGIQCFDKAFRAQFSVNPRKVPLYTAVMQGQKPAGIGYYLPLFFEETAHFLDYLPQDTEVIRFPGIEALAETCIQEAKARYEQYSADITRPILPPKALLFSVSETFERLNRFPNDRLQTQTLRLPVPEMKLSLKNEHAFDLLIELIQNAPCRLLFTFESKRRLYLLQAQLQTRGFSAVIYPDFETCLSKTDKLAFILAPLDSGYLPQLGMQIISESQLFEKRTVPQSRLANRAGVKARDAYQDALELQAGDVVVHVKHGIGLYEGLIQLSIDDIPGEYAQIRYDKEAKLYIPVSDLNLLSPYTGLGDTPKLSTLGRSTWHKAQTEALQKAGDLAANLLQIQAKREAQHISPLVWDKSSYEDFVSDFPFEETPDQLKAIEAVLSDLAASKPMDRVICGDVGFGKTEVALRAAFAVISAGKQVALLAPTTLLVEQHRQTFEDRFAAFPIRIEALSRFQRPKAQKAIIQDLQAGKVDMVIGTHKLLQADVQFQNLGLLIIDEEHRFGVKQKAVFRAWRGQVHCLALTATPIPRTLHMAMGGLRDLSIISTPPLKRLSVKTLVMPFSEAVAKEAILREQHRGGQVYYLHNEVETIEACRERIQAWFPQSKVGVAHGQMREAALEQVMADFYHQRFQILVCTTIIETGIDVPSANTILIERADKLGLAQLHQLRGRVGRSHHQAYAYCFRPVEQKLKADAQKRLDALSLASQLGSGFQLASHDLEIRGAGALLGDAQSGEIQSVGFSLYQRLLHKAVEALKAGKTLSLDDLGQDFADIKLQLPAFIPADYVNDVSLRLRLYKTLSETKTQAERIALMRAWKDRFGALPEPVEHLFFLADCKEMMQALGISALELGARGGFLTVSTDNRIDTRLLLSWIQKAPEVYQLAGANRLRIQQALDDAKARRAFVERLLMRLQGQEDALP